MNKLLLLSVVVLQIAGITSHNHKQQNKIHKNSTFLCFSKRNNNMKAKVKYLLFCFIAFFSYSINVALDPYNPGQDAGLFAVDSLIDPGSAFPFGGNAPIARVQHTISHNSDYLFIYGGYSTNGTLLGDINLFHIPSQTWSNPIRRPECCNDQDGAFDAIGSNIPFDVPFLRPGFEGDYPLPRAEHGACVVDDEMYLFGGVTSDYGFVNDLYKFNSLTLVWTALDRTTGKALPRRRAGHVLIADPSRHRFYLFGGRTTLVGNVNSLVALADVWMYDALGNVWSQLDDPQANGPSGREHVASCGLVRDSFFVFGGSDPSTGLLFDELWRFSVTDGSWSLLSPGLGASSAHHQFSPPPLAYGHLFPALCPASMAKVAVPKAKVLAAMNACGGLLVYGGRGGGGACGSSQCNATHSTLGQLYLYSFEQQSWYVPFFDVNADVLNGGSSNADTSHWLYARLTSSSFLSGADAVRREERGKFVKTYAMEQVVFVPEKRLFFEFGGVQVQNAQAVQDDQEAALFVAGDEEAFRMSAAFTGQRTDISVHAVLRETETMTLESGGRLLAEFSDTQTGETLRSQVTVPSTRFWQLDRQWDSVNADGNVTKVEFLRALRVFSVADRDVVLLQEALY